MRIHSELFYILEKKNTVVGEKIQEKGTQSSTMSNSAGNRGIQD